MKQRLLLPVLLCLVNMPSLFAQISNTETNITLTSYAMVDGMVCSDVPSTGPGHAYRMYVLFEDGDNLGIPKRLPATDYYSCVLTKTTNSIGPVISMDVPGANFPTVNNTSLGWDLQQTKGVVFWEDIIGGGTYHQRWEYNQLICPPLPIYISSFTYTVFSDRLKFDWTAVDESDFLSHYILQKSYNNFHWIDEVFEPANTGLGNHNYTVNVNKPGSNFTWYRLKWIGEYGTFRTTQSIQVFNTGTTATNVVCNYANITGSSSVCAPGTTVYKLHNAPASGAAYNWSAANGTVSSTEQNGLKANIYFSTASNTTVYANAANNSCNKSKAVTVGGTGNVLVTSSITSYSSTHTFYNAWVFELWPGTTASQYNWYINGNYVGGGVSSWPIYTYGPQDCQYVEAKVNTACGEVTGAINLCFLPLCDGCDPERSRDKFKVMPVPANDFITVSMQAGITGEPTIERVKTKTPAMSSDIYTIQLFDMFGNLKLERRNISLNTDQRIDVRQLAVGNYILYIQNAETKVSKQVRIQR